MTLFFRRKKRLRGRNTEETGVLRNVLYGVGTIIAIVLLGYGIRYVTHQESLTLETITVEGGETISHDLVRSKVEGVLKGDYFYIIPYHFAYLYPHRAITEAVNQIPRITNVVVRRISRKELSITFDEYMPSALWCRFKDTPPDCYFINDAGYAFAKAPLLEGGVLVRHYASGEEEFHEGEVISPAILNSMNIFLNLLNDKIQFRVTDVVHTKDGDIEFYINGGGRVLVSETMNATETFDTLVTILTAKEFTHIKPGNFNYIDLRFGKKVFVNEQLETSTTTETGLPEQQ